MATYTSTVTITSGNSPYTLSSGNEINVAGAGNTAGVTNTYNATFSPTFSNQGTIIVTSPSDNIASSTGVFLRGGLTNDVNPGVVMTNGSATNNAAFIEGFRYGVQIEAAYNGNSTASVSNYGTIENTAGSEQGFNAGVVFGHRVSAAFDNAATGVVTGNTGYGVYIKSNGTGNDTLVNAGSIFSQAGFASAEIEQGNATGATGTIVNTGYLQHGAVLNGVIGGTIVNGGTIGLIGGTGGTAGDSAVDTNQGTLVLEAGQTLDGGIATFGAGSALDLAAGSPGVEGTLSNPGSYIGFTSLTVESGADWKIGNQSAATSVPGISMINNFGSLEVGGSLTGTSIDMAGTGATVAFDGNFAGSGPNFVGAPVTNFAATDQIILDGFNQIPGDEIVAYYDSASNVLSITEYDSANSIQDESVQITISGPAGTTPSTADFSYSFGSNGLVVTTDLVPCFAAGTRIATQAGEVLVEDLNVGDQVITVRDRSAQQIVWIGSRTVDLARHANPQKVQPVRIMAGAFGEGLPVRDLRVSPDHALFIDGHLIEAKTLVNGVTIIQETETKQVTYYHVELARHDVLLAEGLPAESYLDSGNRGMFAEGGAALAVHPDFAAASRVGACAPLLLEGDIVTAARARLLERVAELGFTTIADVDLAVRADGALLRPVAGNAGGCLFFILPEGVREVELVSSTGVPAEISADPRDRRTLGVAVTGLSLAAGRTMAELPLDGEGLTGFHDLEDGCRWTNGAARVALPPYKARGAVLGISLRGQAARWHRAEEQAVAKAA